MNDVQLSSSHPLVEEVQTILFSDEPDISPFQERLAADYRMPAADVQKLIYQVIAQLNAALFPPVSQLELILTEGCNLACTYCFEKDMLGYKRMPLEIAQAAIDLLFDYSQDYPLLTITHFGGEPTLNFPAIKHATEYAERKAAQAGKEVEFHTTSNGTRITEEMAAYFARHNIKVLLSIDGLQTTHDRFRLDKRGRGTFAQAMKGFELLKRTQGWVGVKMTVMPVNVATLLEDVQGLYALGVNQFLIGHATGVKWPEEAIHTFAEQWGRLFQWYKESPRSDLRITDFDDLDEDEPGYFGCQAGRNSISVTINGEISPCSKILAIDNKRLLAKLGDVRYGLTHLKNRAELISCTQLRSACEAQGIEKEYEGGCFASNFEDNHNLYQPSQQDHTLSVLKRAACVGCSSCGH